MAKTDRDRACEYLQQMLENVKRENQAVCMAMGPSATFELEVLRLTEHLWWKAQDYKVEGHR